MIVENASWANAPSELYASARELALCVPPLRTTEAKRNVAADAVRTLKRAIAAGWNNAVETNREADLIPLAIATTSVGSWPNCSTAVSRRIRSHLEVPLAAARVRRGAPAPSELRIVASNAMSATTATKAGSIVAVVPAGGKRVRQTFDPGPSGCFGHPASAGRPAVERRAGPDPVPNDVRCRFIELGSFSGSRFRQDGETGGLGTGGVRSARPTTLRAPVLARNHLSEEGRGSGVECGRCRLQQPIRTGLDVVSNASGNILNRPAEA